MIDRRQQIDREIYNRRVELRKVFETPEGKRALARMIQRLGVLHQIPSTESAVALHNEGIRTLDEMGVLDEEGLEYLVKFLINQPVAYKSPVEGENYENE